MKFGGAHGGASVYAFRPCLLQPLRRCAPAPLSGEPLFCCFLRGRFRQLHIVEGVLGVVEDHLYLGERVLQAGKAGRQVGGQRGDLLAGIHVAGARILAEVGQLRVDAPGAHGGIALGLLVILVLI